MKQPWLKPGVLIGTLVPLALMIADAARGRLGADPIAIALNRLGLTALILLWATLAATPLKLLFKVTWGIKLRQLLGLMSFFYASLHFLLYAVVDQGLNLSAILEDVTKRGFITVGFMAFLMMIPLAVTSPASVLKRMGAASWKQLHQLTYVVAILATIHFVWRVKRDFSQPIAYAVVLGALFAVRMLRGGKRSRGAPAR